MAHKQIATIITIGIVVIAVLFAAKLLFVPERLDQTRVISSTGSSEIIASPDQAEAYLRVEILRDTAQAAADESKSVSTRVIDAVKKIEGAEVETTSYNIYKKEDYTPEGPVFKGYVATYSLKATTKKLADIGKIIDAAVANGANAVDNVQFTLSKDAEETIKKDVLKKASENAKEKAQAVADGLGVSLGAVVSVTESGYYAPPFIYAKAAETVAMGRPVSDLQIEPSKITVTATVTVTYKIR